MPAEETTQHSDNAHVVVRSASLDDAAIVSAITDVAYSKWITKIGREPEPMTVNYVEMISKHPVYILLVEEKPVGVLVLKHEVDQTLVWSVAVCPTYQGKGLGLHLLKLAEQEARVHGFRSIRLYTNSLLTENIALYRWLGYEETRREHFRGSTLVHMTKSLS
jgi:ribosomal protein S18 acetylase RimI-like enzyme